MEFRKVEVFSSPPVVGETSFKIIRFKVHLEYTFPQKKRSFIENRRDPFFQPLAFQVQLVSFREGRGFRVLIVVGTLFIKRSSSTKGRESPPLIFAVASHLQFQVRFSMRFGISY